MPKKKTRGRGPSKAGFLITVLICAGAVAAVARYIKVAHADVVPHYEHGQIQPPDEESLTRQPKAHRSRPDVSVTDNQQGAFVFEPVSDSGQLHFAKKAVEVPDGEDAKVFVVNQFLQDTKIADPGARLLSVDIQSGVASLYFNGAMNQTHGTDDESALLNGILTNLGQFPDVRNVLFYAQGKPIESFGNVDLTEPQPVIRDGP